MNSLSERTLVPESPIGKELYERFQEYSFRSNPSESPMARALVAHGYDVKDYPIHPEYTDTDWLISTVSMNGLQIIFRHPTPEDVLVYYIRRETTDRKMSSVLFGIVEFFSFCRYHCPGLKYVGGEIDKHINDRNRHREDQFDRERLIIFYNRLLGDVESYERNGTLYIFAEVHRDMRFEKFPIWKRYRKNETLSLL